MADKNDAALREHLVKLLTLAEAHATFDDAVNGLPEDLRAKAPKGAEHSPWQLLEHLRLAQWDILEFSRNAKHASPKWPEGYWPKLASPPNEKAWDESVRRFKSDRRAMRKLVTDKARDLSAIVPHGQSQTLIREALLLMDHNAYHVGQLITLRQLLGAWK